jgi:hypothetical protein
VTDIIDGEATFLLSLRLRTDANFIAFGNSLALDKKEFIVGAVNTYLVSKGKRVSVENDTGLPEWFRGTVAAADRP